MGGITGLSFMLRLKYSMIYELKRHFIKTLSIGIISKFLKKTAD